MPNNLNRTTLVPVTESEFYVYQFVHGGKALTFDQVTGQWYGDREAVSKMREQMQGFSKRMSEADETKRELAFLREENADLRNKMRTLTDAFNRFMPLVHSTLGAYQQLWAALRPQVEPIMDEMMSAGRLPEGQEELPLDQDPSGDFLIDNLTTFVRTKRGPRGDDEWKPTTYAAAYLSGKYSYEQLSRVCSFLEIELVDVQKDGALVRLAPGGENHQITWKCDMWLLVRWDDQHERQFFSLQTSVSLKDRFEFLEPREQNILLHGDQRDNG